MQQAQQEHPAHFYANLVELRDKEVPRWAGEIPLQPVNQVPAGSTATAPPAAGVSKPILFRSSGVHDMSSLTLPGTGSGSTRQRSTQFETRGPGPPPAARTRPTSLQAAEALLESQWQAAQAAFASKEKATQPRLASSNPGYKLLQLAGWNEGEGLGARNQGRVVPLDASKNPGLQGIGYQKKAQPKVVVVQQGAAAQGAGSAAAGETAAARAAKRSKVADIVAAELEGETVEQKIALHRAVAAAEEEQAKGRALQRALFRAFNDPFDNANAPTANTNPIGRKTRLTATNPLLNSDDDD